MPSVEKNQRNAGLCRCPMCPSYTACANRRQELLFCSNAVRMSSCDVETLGCLCEDCPVHEEHNLITGYYCKRGSADDIDYLNKMD